MHSMQFERDNGSATYQINRYKNRSIAVNNQTYSNSIVVMPEQLLSPWGPDSFEALTVEHFEMLLPYKPQVVLLGTGERLRFPDQKIFSALLYHNIGVEVMNTAAACRTYAILMAEGRKVAAALLC